MPTVNLTYIFLVNMSILSFIWISIYVKCLLRFSLPFFYQKAFSQNFKIKKYLFLNMLDVSILLLRDDLHYHSLNGVFQLTQSHHFCFRISTFGV